MDRALLAAELPRLQVSGALDEPRFAADASVSVFGVHQQLEAFVDVIEQELGAEKATLAQETLNKITSK